MTHTVKISYDEFTKGIEKATLFRRWAETASRYGGTTTPVAAAERGALLFPLWEEQRDLISVRLSGWTCAKTDEAGESVEYELPSGMKGLILRLMVSGATVALLEATHAFEEAEEEDMRRMRLDDQLLSLLFSTETGCR